MSLWAYLIQTFIKLEKKKKITCWLTCKHTKPSKRHHTLTATYKHTHINYLVQKNQRDTGGSAEPILTLRVKFNKSFVLLARRLNRSVLNFCLNIRSLGVIFFILLKLKQDNVGKWVEVKSVLLKLHENIKLSSFNFNNLSYNNPTNRGLLINCSSSIINLNLV